METTKFVVYNFENGELEYFDTQNEALLRFFDISIRYIGPLVHYSAFQKVTTDEAGNEVWTSSNGDLLEYVQTLSSLKEDVDNLNDRIASNLVPPVEII
jgi:hypothetical protein